MARTINEILEQIVEAKERIQEIYNAITGDVADDATLAVLDSPSKTATWRLWAYIQAVCFFIHEALWHIFKVEIEDIVAKAIPMTKRWYRDKILEFQYGDDLLFIDYVPQYAVVDESKQIVAQCAIVEGMFNRLLVKVAKEENGELVALDGLELQGVLAYINAIKAAGTTIQVVSLNADLLRIYAEVHYNPVFILGQVQADVESAIVEFIAHLPFNSELLLSQLTDVVQLVDGVIDVKLNKLEASQGGAFIEAQRAYDSVAGYAKVDESTPLNSSIAYIPYTNV